MVKVIAFCTNRRTRTNSASLNNLTKVEDAVIVISGKEVIDFLMELTEHD
jgi:hypothetical protein